MSIHQLKIREPWFERVAAGQKRAEVRKHDRDFQVGDTLHLIEVSDYGNPNQHYVERDARGRFVNDWRENDPVFATITHVLPAAQADGIEAGYCVLSIEVMEAQP
jgi:hypothetical protein